MNMQNDVVNFVKAVALATLLGTLIWLGIICLLSH